MESRLKLAVNSEQTKNSLGHLPRIIFTKYSRYTTRAPATPEIDDGRFEEADAVFWR
jgi:hypothetical protein